MGLLAVNAAGALWGLVWRVWIDRIGTVTFHESNVLQGAVPEAPFCCWFNIFIFMFVIEDQSLGILLHKIISYYIKGFGSGLGN